jgi:hypothetical protein
VTPDIAKQWMERELSRLGRDACPSSQRFPSRAALADLAPEPVLDARDFYRQACFDWGSAWIFRFDVASESLFVVYAGTDGDTGWLELFDIAGALLAVASLDGDRVVWEPRDVARARVASGDLP